MATEVKRRRGSDSDHVGFTGAVAELTVNTDDWTVHVHDGTNNYGYPLLRQDFDNVPTTAPFTHITLDTAIFDTAYTETESETQGTLYWNQDEETLSLVTNGETIELGQKVEIHVKNQTGAQINKGEVVYASGTVGNSGRILVTKMIADGTVAAKRVLGVAAENIANGADGKVIKFGKLRKIDTTAFNEGDILWVSTTVAGAFQNTEPSQSAGDIALPIAFVVTDSASVGEIFIRVTPIDENEYTNYSDYVELRSDVIENHLEIESLQDNKVEVGFLFPDGDGQALGTGDNVTFNTVTLGEQADSANEAVRADRNVSAGNGVTGGGDLTADRTLTLGTPSTTTVGGSNAVTADSHTHALDLSGRSITLSNDSDSVITFDTNTQDLGADRTYTPTIADHASGQRGVLSVNAQTIYGAKSFNNDIFPLADVETTDFSSWFTTTPTGYQISQTGVGDFRTLYIDELVAKAFTADVAQALAGSDILTKSVGILAENYTVASVGSTTSTIVVEDLPGLGGFAVFENGDYIRMRVVDRTAGLTIGDVYASVTLDTSYGTNGFDSSTSTQRYILDIESAGSGDVLVGQKLYKGAVILDYGTSGSYYIERTVLDRSSGSDFSKVPYNRIVQWTNTVSGSPNPSDSDTVITVITQSGNLANLTSTYSYSADPDGAFPAFAVDGFGFFSDNAYLTGEFRVGDLQSYGEFIQYNTTDGLTIKIGDEDDLSASVAELRQDLIDIYLADQSTFAGIQFLSGQITLKVGADGKVASARLDATGDESAITLRADFFDFQSNDIVILGDPDQDEGTEAKIALGSNADTITVGNNTPGFIASGAGTFKAYIDANNYIRLDQQGLDVKAEEFDLIASDLLINSGTNTQTSYTPTTNNNLLDNYNFATAPNFGDSSDWDGNGDSFSTISYDATLDAVKFVIQKNYSSANSVTLFQELDSISTITDKTVQFDVLIQNGNSGTSVYNWFAGDLELIIEGKISGTYRQINKTTVNYLDVSGQGGTATFSVSALVRDDFTDLQLTIKYPQQYSGSSGAPIIENTIYIKNVSTKVYDKTQVTLNNNGLSVFKSPIQEFELTADSFSLNGVGIQTDDLSIPNLVELERVSTSSMRVPNEGYASFAYTEISGTSRLYIRLSDGTLKYVNLTS